MKLTTKTNYSHACKEAANRAAKDYRIRYVFATNCGYRISLQRLPFQDCYYVKPSGDDGIWSAYAKLPISRREIVAEEARKLLEEIDL